MPGLPVIPDTFRVALRWTNADGGYAINVMHFRATAGGNEQDLHDTLNSYWENDMQQTMSTAGDQGSMVITELNGVNAGIPFDGVGNSQGQSSGNPIPNQATIVSFYTALGGPQNRGRIYMPFVSETDVNNGLLDAGRVATQQASWDNWLPSMQAADFEPVVASYKYEDCGPITRIKVQAYAGTQRRRLSRLRS